MYHAMCMWEEKTLLIPGWNYVSTAEWDCSALPAMLLYGLTDNILLSFALANIFHVLLYSWILIRLHKNLGLHGKYAFVTVLMILIPFEFGMLSYSNMLFYSAAQYVYKILLPVWMIKLLTMPENSWKKIQWRIELILFGALSFLTAISSGLYVFLCGMFPLIACSFVFFLYSNRKKLWVHRIVVCVVSCLMTFSGYVMQKVLGLSSHADSLNIVSLRDFVPKLTANLTNLLELGRALPPEEISLYTPGGIMYVARFVFLVCVLCFGLSGLKEWFADHSLDDETNTNDMVRFACAALGGVFVWNTFIQQLTIDSARYHLIGYVPLMIAAGITFSAGTKKQKPVIRNARFACAAGFLFVLMAGCWYSAFSDIGNSFADYYGAVSQVAEEQEADSVVFVNGSSSAELARVFDPERIYVAYSTSNRSLYNYDAYTYYDDRGALTDRHLLISTDWGGVSDLPAYLRDGYTKVGEVFGDIVYLSEHCRLDGAAGPMPGHVTIDYPYTQGYIFDADMEKTGTFPCGEERIVVQSPVFEPCSADVKVMLNYQLESGKAGGWIDIDVPGKEPQHVVVNPDEQWVEFSIPAGNAFSFDIRVGEEAMLTVEQVVFDCL